MTNTVLECGNVRQKAENAAGYLFISPWLIGFFVFGIIPMGASLYFSFTDYDMLSPPRWIGTANYERLIRDAKFLNSLSATLYFVFVSVPLKLAVSLMIAMLLNVGRAGLSLYRTLYYIPSVIGGSVAVAIMWRQIFGAEGALNGLLAFMGVHSAVSWTGDPRTAIWTLILLAAWQFGSPMLIFLAGLKQIPEHLYESAKIDGAGPVKQWLRITLPMLSPVIFFNLVMQLISGFLVFTQSYIVTNGGPLDTTLFIAVYIYQKSFVHFDLGYGSALAWVLLLIIALFTALVFKFSTAFIYYETKGGN